ncbi:bacterioferritin-associated ferredoxin [Bradyrhizobium jicamae]|uniref:(2Fe-2S)-binding protein n=1 Tax=Bradyrhizobium jicamae TaxID=280332 RepID=UPI001BAD05E1|nr:(2Fe-2S)-binding protein [Bradyrhizobium jicamae]MBR0931750.1 (2Fe-2S)-binding protein [Bradyrhizobium jicamae]
MIVCSCNVFSDIQVQAAIAGSVEQLRMSRVYASLGCSAQCGRCAHTIRDMIAEFIHRATLARFPDGHEKAEACA